MTVIVAAGETFPPVGTGRRDGPDAARTFADDARGGIFAAKFFAATFPAGD